MTDDLCPRLNCCCDAIRFLISAKPEIPQKILQCHFPEFISCFFWVMQNRYIETMSLPIMGIVKPQMSLWEKPLPLMYVTHGQVLWANCHYHKLHFFWHTTMFDSLIHSPRLPSCCARTHSDTQPHLQLRFHSVFTLSLTAGMNMRRRQWRAVRAL